jgi:hypothetical protein
VCLCAWSTKVIIYILCHKNDTVSFNFSAFSVNFVIALMMEAVSNSETSVSFYQTARHNIPEHSHLQICKILYSCVMNVASAEVGWEVWSSKLDGR